MAKKGTRVAVEEGGFHQRGEMRWCFPWEGVDPIERKGFFFFCRLERPHSRDLPGSAR